MDLFTILGTCLRRWYVFLPVLAISGYFAMQAYQQVEPLYSASTSIVILPSQPLPGAPDEADTLTLDNPYAGSGGPKLAAAVLAKNIDSSTFRDRLGLTPDDTSIFESTVAQTQPIITVDATASSPEAVISTLGAVTIAARVVLDDFQAVAEAPEAKRYLVAAAVPPSAATDVTPSRWRTAGAILVVGAGLAALLAVALDAALRARRRNAELSRARSVAGSGPTIATAPGENEVLASDLEPIASFAPEGEPPLEPAESDALLHGRSRSALGGPARPVSVPRARASHHQDK